MGRRWRAARPAPGRCPRTPVRGGPSCAGRRPAGQWCRGATYRRSAGAGAAARGGRGLWPAPGDGLSRPVGRGGVVSTRSARAGALGAGMGMAGRSGRRWGGGRGRSCRAGSGEAVLIRGLRPARRHGALGPVSCRPCRGGRGKPDAASSPPAGGSPDPARCGVATRSGCAPGRSSGTARPADHRRGTGGGGGPRRTRRGLQDGQPRDGGSTRRGASCSLNAAMAPEVRWCNTGPPPASAQGRAQGALTTRGPCPVAPLPVSGPGGVNPERAMRRVFQEMGAGLVWGGHTGCAASLVVIPEGRPAHAGTWPAPIRRGPAGASTRDTRARAGPPHRMQAQPPPWPRCPGDVLAVRRREAPQQRAWGRMGPAEVPRMCTGSSASPGDPPRHLGGCTLPKAEHRLPHCRSRCQ